MTIRKGELIQFYIPLNRKSPIYIEIIGRIEKQCISKEDSEFLNINDENKSILLYDIPVNLTREYLNNVFNTFGEIKEITFNNSNEIEDEKDHMLELNKSVNSWVYITYCNNESINRIRDESIKEENSFIRKLYLNNLEKNICELVNFRNKVSEITGTRVNAKILQKEVDIYMTKYDIEREIEEENLRLESTVPDKDGFIRVVNKKQKAPDGTVIYSFEPEREIQDFRVKKQINKKEKKVKLYNDFYRFQILENKKKEVEKLDNLH